ncbi:unnamed protein product [Brachionus calyciflorus]|uniref:Uncharacterized protein n=1 Tax=Brachionus calyciflorus TaxID=104777 RepID=A0A813M9X1_9BILA|nr:unnamed protein product [Brachionus calyciflorus]
MKFFLLFLCLLLASSSLKTDDYHDDLDTIQNQNVDETTQQMTTNTVFGTVVDSSTKTNDDTTSNGENHLSTPIGKINTISSDKIFQIFGVTFFNSSQKSYFFSLNILASSIMFSILFFKFF